MKLLSYIYVYIRYKCILRIIYLFVKNVVIYRVIHRYAKLQIKAENYIYYF